MSNPKRTTRISRFLTLLAAAAIYLAAAPLRADDTAAPDSADSASSYLGNIYKDEKAGIRFAPPRGSATSASPGDEIVSFAIKDKMWVGDLLTVNLKDDTTIQDFLSQSVSQLSKDFKGVQVLESREITFQKHKAGRLTITLEGDISDPGPNGGGHKQIVTLFRQQLMIQMSAKQYLILQFWTPFKDRKIAEDTFTAMLANFEFIDRAQADKQRLDAIKLGKEWLAKQSAEDLKSRLINQSQMFRMKAAGKDVGFMQFDELEIADPNSKISVGFTGVALQMKSQSWPDDHTVVMAQNIAFWAYNHDEKTHAPRPDFSNWINVTKTLATGKELPNGQYLFWISEGGVLSEEENSRLDPATLEELKKERTELVKQNPGYELPAIIDGPQKIYHLKVTYDGDKTQAFQALGKGVEARIPEYRPAILPKILEYCWPRLVDLTKPSTMTFCVFNASDRKRNIDYRTLSVIGPEHIISAGKPYDAIKCRDEIGNDGTTIWVDRTGKILKMLTTSQALIEPTTEEQMLKLWGPALERTKQALNPAAGQPDNKLSRAPN